MKDGRVGAAPAVKGGSEALGAAAWWLPTVRGGVVVPADPPPVVDPPPAPPVLPPVLPPLPPVLPLVLPPELPEGAGDGGAGKLTVVVAGDDSTTPPLALRRGATIANCCWVPATFDPNWMLTEQPELSQTDEGSRPPRVMSEPPLGMSKPTRSASLVRCQKNDATVPWALPSKPPTCAGGRLKWIVVADDFVEPT